MTDRVRIFSRGGKILQEFNALAERSWTLTNGGRASFSVSVFDTSICNETVLQFYNWVLIENDLLPAWIGTVGTWSFGARQVLVTCFSIDSSRGFFNTRIGPPEEKRENMAGDIFEYLINKANSAEASILQIGNVYKGGGVMTETFNPNPLYKDLVRLSERSKQFYQFRPVVGDGGLIIYCDWLARLGSDTQFRLSEGDGGGNVEISNKLLVQDAPTGNSYFAYGDGASWASIPSKTVTDEASRAKFGLVQYSKKYAGVTSIATLEKNAESDLLISKIPTDKFALFALNIGDTFMNMKMGNRVWLYMGHVGFTNGNIGTVSYVSIIALYYNPANGEKIEVGVSKNAATA